jgi:hypothetical protein
MLRAMWQVLQPQSRRPRSLNPGNKPEVKTIWNHVTLFMIAKRSDRLQHFVVDAQQRALFESSCFSEIYYQQCFCADTRYVREKLIFKKPLSGEKGQYFEDSTKNNDMSIDVQKEIFEVDPCMIQFSTWIQELMIWFVEQEKLFLTPEIEAALSTHTYCMGDLTNDS